MLVKIFAANSDFFFVFIINIFSMFIYKRAVKLNFLLFIDFQIDGEKEKREKKMIFFC